MERIIRRSPVGLTTAVFALADVAVVVACAAATVLVRYAFGGQYEPALYWELWPALGLFSAAFAAQGLYPGALLAPPEELKRLCQGASLVYLGLGAGTFLVREGELYSRSIFAVSWALTLVALPALRALLRRRLAPKPWWGFPAVVIGDTDLGGLIVRSLARHPELAVKPAVLVLEGEGPADAGSVPVVPVAVFREKIARFACAYAVVAAPEGRRGDMLALVESLGRHFRTVILVPDLMARASLWVTTVDFGGLLGLELRQKLFDPGRRAVKRALDLTLTLLGGLPALPFCLAVALAIRLETRGPALFRQTRIGADGREIRVFKFRTMVRDADAVLAACLEADPERCREWRETQKLRSDPRVTRIGRWLRTYSLDELPQLLNVLSGDMSLVGPRPIVQEEIARYGDLFPLYARVRPGLTGLWQVSGRNDLAYAERVALDAYYIRNWSVWLDLWILFRTLPVVLSGQGAY